MRIFEKNPNRKSNRKKSEGKKKPGKDFSRARGAEHTPKGYEKKFFNHLRNKEITNKPHPPLFPPLPLPSLPGKNPRKTNNHHTIFCPRPRNTSPSDGIRRRCPICLRPGPRCLFCGSGSVIDRKSSPDFQNNKHIKLQICQPEFLHPIMHQRTSTETNIFW